MDSLEEREEREEVRGCYGCYLGVCRGEVGEGVVLFFPSSVSLPSLRGIGTETEKRRESGNWG